MKLESVPFATVNWDRIPIEEHAGERGNVRSRTFSANDLRVRMVEYSPGYVADHWCSKGHVVLCVRGEILSHHQDGSVHAIREGMVYIVGDNDVPHRSASEHGASLFIVD